MIVLLSTFVTAGLAQIHSSSPGSCPFLEAKPAGMPMRPLSGQKNEQQVEEYLEAFAKIDFNEVKKDLAEAMVNSRDFWPADYDNYGPFWVRMAWHCSGSYRAGDGRGGCDGGKQRFDPERSWDDNTNLDKARKTVFPIKQKYGLGLSWGDLLILAGTVAIEQMGGPVLGFCGGRIDDINGLQSEPLGFNGRPTYVPCETQGFCKAPSGGVVTGLLYVNPEGPGGEPDPVGEARDIRDTFARMSMNDTESVALIGGGHAFGKFHGACPDGPGTRPSENEKMPWQGTCGEPPLEGKGINTFTSGFEGPWTEDPTRFTNTYFKYLVENTFEKYIGPGGHYQWRVSGGPAIPPAPRADLKGYQDIQMLTSDIAFQFDPENIYQGLIKAFYEDMDFLSDQFSHAWYKLVTRDMGPVTRCLGDMVAPPQIFQAPLPPTPTELEYKLTLKFMDKIIQAVDGVIARNSLGVANAGAHLIRLAFSCASSFRQTDYQGGCNGARIRFAPEKDFGVNHGLETAMQLLTPIEERYGDYISWADLIVLGGTRAIMKAGGDPMAFCGGRTDASPDERLEIDSRRMLEGRVTGEESDSSRELKYQTELMGLTDSDIVAILGAARQLDAQIWTVSGFKPKTTDTPLQLDNTFFKVLLANEWVQFTVPISNQVMYVNKCYVEKTQPCDGQYKIHTTDFLLTVDDTLTPIAISYANDDALFKKNLAIAWTKLMNADRFDGPGRNLCNTRPDLVHGFEAVQTHMAGEVQMDSAGLPMYRHTSHFHSFLRRDDFDEARMTEALASESTTLFQGANTLAMVAGYVGLAAALVALFAGRFRGGDKPNLEVYVSEETPLRQ